MGNNVNELINSIIQISFDNLPVEEGWEKYEINVLSLRLYREQKAYYFLDDGKKVSFNPQYKGVVAREDNISELFMDLRKTMYSLSPQQGAWFSCKIVVYPSGEFNTSFNYEDYPDFTYTPAKEKFIDDLKSFPRENDLIPNWLNNIQQSNNQ